MEIDYVMNLNQDEDFIDSVDIIFKHQTFEIIIQIDTFYKDVKQKILDFILFSQEELDLDTVIIVYTNNYYNIYLLDDCMISVPDKFRSILLEIGHRLF